MLTEKYPSCSYHYTEHTLRCIAESYNEEPTCITFGGEPEHRCTDPLEIAEYRADYVWAKKKMGSFYFMAKFLNGEY